MQAPDLLEHPILLGLSFLFVLDLAYHVEQLTVWIVKLPFPLHHIGRVNGVVVAGNLHNHLSVTNSLHFCGGLEHWVLVWSIMIDGRPDQGL